MHDAWARKLLLAALCVLSWHSAVQAVQTEEPVHLTTAQMLVSPGHGYSLPPYQVNDADLQGTWETVALPHVLTRSLIPPVEQDNPDGPLTVMTWYRMQVPSLAPSTKVRFLYIPRWKTDGQIAVYGDGRLLYQSHTSVYWNGSNIPLWIALNETAGDVMPRTILLRIERPQNSGGGISSVWAGPENRLGWRYGLRYLLQVGVPSENGLQSTLSPGQRA